MYIQSEYKLHNCEAFYNNYSCTVLHEVHLNKKDEFHSPISKQSRSFCPLENVRSKTIVSPFIPLLPRQYTLWMSLLPFSFHSP